MWKVRGVGEYGKVLCKNILNIKNARMKKICIFYGILVGISVVIETTCSPRTSSFGQCRLQVSVFLVVLMIFNSGRFSGRIDFS